MRNFILGVLFQLRLTVLLKVYACSKYFIFVFSIKFHSCKCIGFIIVMVRRQPALSLFKYESYLRRTEYASKRR